MSYKHAIWMVIGCALPILLIFLFPVFGIKGNLAVFIFVILMFSCHLFMTRGHRKEGREEHRRECEEEFDEHP